jgi:isoleucyl-tRNA synthetase
LAFTSEEIWENVPPFPGKSESVHMELLPEPISAYEDDSLEEQWGLVLDVRAEVNRALELARKNKEVGHSLDAEITLGVRGALMENLKGREDMLSRVFIVSQVRLVDPESFDSATAAVDIPGLMIQVRPASAMKCARCWVHDETVGTESSQPEICSRCVKELHATAS